MKKTVWCVLASVILCASSFAAGGAEAKGAVTLSGYLIDKHCFEMKNPAEETVMCLNMEMCQKDGYGIAVEQSDGAYKFFLFDADGHNKAHGIVVASKAEKLGKITVTGKLDGDKFIVSTIEVQK